MHRVARSLFALVASTTCAGLASAPSNAQVIAVPVPEQPTDASDDGTGEIVPGDMLVKLAAVDPIDHMTEAEADASLRARFAAIPAFSTYGAVFVRRSVLGWVLVKIPGASAAQTLAAVEALRHVDGVLGADANHIAKPASLPNDPLLPYQWGHLELQMEETWEISRGNANQYIGVVDSGLHREHPDVQYNDKAGYDFVSDPASALDGDARDADYQDTNPEGESHGTHVFGIIGAHTNNGEGIAGINQEAYIISARALARQGNFVDILEASAWLAGMNVAGVPSLPDDMRVGVMNLSLGGDAPCSDSSREVFEAIVARGITVVVATGNDGFRDHIRTPANCPGVIAVGAIGANLEMSDFSDFGPGIDVLAPGGSHNNDNIVSCVDPAIDGGYAAYGGTSMAAPMVAAVASLMLDVNPNLSPSQIESIIKDSPFTCANDTCSGVATLNALDAVTKAKNTTGSGGGNNSGGGGNNGGGGNTGGGGGNNNGGGGCPPNSQLEGDKCFCDPGFVVNAAQNACVPESDGGSEGGGSEACASNADSCESDDRFEDDGFDSSASSSRYRDVSCNAAGGSLPAFAALALLTILRPWRRRR